MNCASVASGSPPNARWCSGVHEMDSFATADEIHRRVHTLSAAVDISTVYRTLDLLQGFALIATVEGGDGQRRYKLLIDHVSHAHLVSASCAAR